MILTTTLPRAWKAFTENKRYLLLILLFEFIFLFVLAQIHLAILMPSSETIERVQNIMAEEMQKLPETELYQLESVLMNNEEFMMQYKIVLTSITYFILALLAAWIAFKAPVWHLSHKSILKNMPLGTSILKFSLLSVFWFVLLFASFVIYRISTGSQTVLPLVSSTTASLIMIIVALVIYYFSQVSFALIPAQQTFKKTFVFGIKHASTILPAFLINTIITFIVLSLPFNWIETMPLLSLAIILFVTIPALAFTRLHLIIATWQKHSS